MLAKFMDTLKAKSPPLFKKKPSHRLKHSTSHIRFFYNKYKRIGGGYGKNWPLKSQCLLHRSFSEMNMSFGNCSKNCLQVKIQLLS